MAYHTVGRIHRLVGPQTGQTADQQPEGRRHDAVVEALGQALDRRRRHTRPVQLGGVAADDAGDGEPGGRQVLRRPNEGDMLIEAALRQAGTGQ